jgi:AraC-like DNA-binding protein
MPPLVHAGVRRLVRSDSRWQPARVAAYFLPPFLIGLLVIFWRDVIDYALIAIYLGYAVALLLFLRSGPDTLRLAPFEGVVPVYRAVIFAAGALCLSAAVDILILFDVHRSQGAHILTIINIANLLGVFVLGMAAAVANQSRPPIATVETLSQTELDEDGDTLVHIDALMQDKKIYRDANLNLDRLSRKAAIPARRISTAINRALAKNVSQYVNDYRISEACRLLVETDRPVTEIMFDVGFQTKSNFNREFRRVTETNPLAWREGKVGSA